MVKNVLFSLSLSLSLFLCIGLGIDEFLNQINEEQYKYASEFAVRLGACEHN
jgi:hypothetical protein